MKIQPIRICWQPMKKQQPKPQLFKGFNKPMKVIAKAVLLCLLALPVVAEEANQAITLEDNKAVITVQKQPNDEKSTQKQDVKRNWFCIIVQVNGKVMDLQVLK